MSRKCNVLTEPLLAYTSSEGTRTDCTLSGLLRALSEGNAVASFVQLRAHQEHSWYAFLVQVAALSTEDLTSGEFPLHDEVWRERLQALTPGVEQDAWSLAVEDPATPAFLQPPVSPSDYKSFYREDSPAAMNVDTLVPTRNHAIKSDFIRRPEALDWIYTLVELQTASNYGGPGNFHIMRMNGAYSSRPCVTIVPGIEYGERFRRDVQLLRKYAPAIAERHGFDHTSGSKLLWLLPWDGKAQLSIDSLHPYSVEVARRIRLVNEDGRWLARRGTSKKPRIEAKHYMGAVGDPWVPIDRTRNVALTVPEAGFGYQRVQKLLMSGDWIAPITQTREKLSDSAYLYCWAVARGQVQTNGLRRRLLPIPARVLPRLNLFESTADQELSELSEQRIQRVAACSKSVLSYPLRILFREAAQVSSRESRPSKTEQDVVREAREMFEAGVDRVFFDSLWSDLELSSDERATRWEETIVKIARRTFASALKRVSQPEARRLSRAAKAWNAFEARAYRFLHREGVNSSG